MTLVHLNIELIRKRKGVTKSHIARGCERTPQWYSKVAKGDITLDVVTLQRIADVLEVDVTNFFDNKLSETLNFREKQLA